MEKRKLKVGDSYSRKMSPFYFALPENVQFEKETYTKKKTEQVARLEVEQLDILDIGRYKKKEILQRIESFIKENDFLHFIKKIKNLRKDQFIQNYQPVFEIKDEFCFIILIYIFIIFR